MSRSKLYAVTVCALFLFSLLYVDVAIIGATDSNYVIIDEATVSDERCNVGSKQTIGFHARWSNINSSVVSGELIIEDEQGGFKKLSSGKIFYDTFSKSWGTETDEVWHQGFTWYAGRVFDDGYWEVENGKFKAIYDGGNAFTYPEVLVEDFIWEAKVNPLSLSREGPEIRFQELDSEGDPFQTSVYDYYHSGRRLRLMINKHNSAHSTYLSKEFTMDENTWYTMRYEAHGKRVVCSIDGEKIFDKTDNKIVESPRRLIHCGYTEGETGYLDDVKIWESNYIYLNNTVSGQKIELYDENGILVSEETATGDSLELDVSSLSFPFNGYFKVYESNGKLDYTTQIYDDIWGGDEYWAGRTIELITDEEGWAYFEDSLSAIDVETWSVVEVDCNGVTEFIQNTSSPSIIWDRVSLQHDADDHRIDAGSSASIDVHGVYEYDNSVFNGTVYFNDNLFQGEVGKIRYMVDQIVDPLYGITGFNSNEVDIVFDRVNIDLEVQDSCIDVGELVRYSWTGQYAYDKAPFQGEIELNYPDKMDEVGERDYTVSSIIDPLYGLTAFQSDSFKCIWDRVEVYDGGISNEVSRVGDMETVWYKARYEYGGEELTERDGVLFVNGMPLVWSSFDNQWKHSTSLDASGSRVFEVTGVEDENYGLSVINDKVGPLSIVWEKPFWETPIGIISIGGLTVLIGSTVLFLLRERI